MSRVIFETASSTMMTYFTYDVERLHKLWLQTSIYNHAELTLQLLFEYYITEHFCASAES